MAVLGPKIVRHEQKLMYRDLTVSLEGPNVHKATTGVESSLSKSVDFESRQLGFAKIADMLGDKLRRAYGRNGRWVFSKWRHTLLRRIKVYFLQNSAFESGI